MQVELLEKKPHVLVATPGRLLDLADSGAASLGAYTCRTSEVHAFTEIEQAVLAPVLLSVQRSLND